MAATNMCYSERFQNISDMFPVLIIFESLN